MSMDEAKIRGLFLFIRVEIFPISAVAVWRPPLPAFAAFSGP
jgi:hypothetical protein